MNQPFTIVDIETTGNGIRGNKITEISIFRLEGDKITDEFTSLVNPECDIPYFITGLTGIDSQMVRHAPTLRELAPKIDAITKDCIFVAHSVNFDYNVIKHEFKNIGLDFRRKRLCTVRLSRSVFPGLQSYSLGKLCSALGIEITDRHRARGDAEATVTLFRKIRATEGSDLVIDRFLNARSQEATLPPALPRAAYENLPARPGVYFFKDASGKIIYVGKAIDIKKRVLGHFYDKSDKEVRLCRETADIAYELSGSELLALLMESAAIKQHFPVYNQAQKRHGVQYALFGYEDRNGIRHLAFNHVKMAPEPLICFYNTTDCRLFLEQLCIDFNLCAKYCHLQESVEHCAHFRIPACGGVCRGTQTIEAYNKQVEAAIRAVRERNRDLIIREAGRDDSETAFVLIRDGQYCGYGFIPREYSLGGLKDALAYMKPQKNTIETKRLLDAYTAKNPQHVIALKEVVE